MRVDDEFPIALVRHMANQETTTFVDLTCVLNVIMPKSHRCDVASSTSNHANDASHNLDTPPDDNLHPPRHHVAPM